MLKIIQIAVISGLSLYASVLTILTIHDEVKSLLKLPSKFEVNANNLSGKLEDLFSKYSGKLEDLFSKYEDMIKSWNGSTNKTHDGIQASNLRIEKIEEVQGRIEVQLQQISKEANASHAKSIRDGGNYIWVIIRTIKAESEEGAANFISYDVNSKYLTELRAEGAYHHYQVFLNNPDNRYDPFIISNIHGTTGKGLKNKQKSDFTFRVAPAIFKALGGDYTRTSNLKVTANPAESYFSTE